MKPVTTEIVVIVALDHATLETDALLMPRFKKLVPRGMRSAVLKEVYADVGLLYARALADDEVLAARAERRAAVPKGQRPQASGGRARAAKLTPARRAQIAHVAACTRWNKRDAANGA